MRMTPVRVKMVKTQSQIVHLSFKKTQASREVKTGLLRVRGLKNDGKRLIVREREC